MEMKARQESLFLTVVINAFLFALLACAHNKLPLCFETSLIVMTHTSNSEQLLPLKRCVLDLSLVYRGKTNLVMLLS